MLQLRVIAPPPPRGSLRGKVHSSKILGSSIEDIISRHAQNLATSVLKARLRAK